MRSHTSIYHSQFTRLRGTGQRRGDAKDRTGPIMATRPYLLIHQRGDSDGQIARFLESNSPPTVPCLRPLVVISRRARSDRRRGLSVCQLVGSEQQCPSLLFSLSSPLTRDLSHTPRGSAWNHNLRLVSGVARTPLGTHSSYLSRSRVRGQVMRAAKSCATRPVNGTDSGHAASRRTRRPGPSRWAPRARCRGRGRGRR